MLYFFDLGKEAFSHLTYSCGLPYVGVRLFCCFLLLLLISFLLFYYNNFIFLAYFIIFSWINRLCIRVITVIMSMILLLQV